MKRLQRKSNFRYLTKPLNVKMRDVHIGDEMENEVLCSE